MNAVRSIAVGVLCLAAGAAEAETKKSSLDYVQGGLVAMWDGYENSGRGYHREAATKWVDLVRGVEVDIPDWVTVEETSLLSVSDTSHVATQLGSVEGLSSSDASWTIEIVQQSCGWRKTDNPLNLQNVFSTPRGALGYRQNNAKGFYFFGPSSATQCSLQNWVHATEKIADIHTMTAKLGADMSTSAIWMDAVQDTVNYNGGYTANRQTVFSFFGNPRMDIRVYAIRVYNRELTSEEIAANHAVDVTRFVDGGYARDGVLVVGSPAAFGTPDPGYGLCLDVSPGETVKFAPPVAGEANDIRWRCTGWEFVTESGEKTNGTGEAEITYAEYGTLTWLLNVENKVTATTGDGWTVLPETQWVANGGSAVVTVTPPAGMGLLRWEDENGTVLGRDETLVLSDVSGPVTVTPVFGRLIHVETTGSDATGDGSQAKPYATLTNGVAHAQAGDTVLLGEGTFEIDSQVELTTAVTVKGAGRDKTTVRQTKKTGDVTRGFYLNDAGAVVRDLVITGGSLGGYNYGSGVWIDTKGGIVQDCRITGNTCGMNSTAAVYLTGANALVARCIIDSNRNDNNYAGGGGTAMKISKGRAESCLIRNTYCNGANSSGPAVIVANDAAAVIVNCTIVGNSAPNAAGISVGASGRAYNCIVCDNISRNGADNPNWSGTGSSLVNCVFEAPGFADAANGDYSLRGASSAVDAGGEVEFKGGGTDLAGNPRVLRKVDLGCYENTDDETTLLVTATPSEYGTVTPTYGTVGSLQPGDHLVDPFTAPEGFTEDGVDIVCDGWKLYSQNARTLEWTLIGESGEGDKLSCAYEHPTPAARTKLVWQWRTACHIAAEATGGGRVSAPSQSLGFGEKASIEAIPDDDVFFSRWTGDVPKGMERDNPLVFTVDAAHSVTAHFIAKTTYVRPKTDAAANPVAPYRSRETAATDIGDFVDDLVDDCKVVVMDGVNDVGRTVSLNFAVTFEGEHGMTNATVRRTGATAADGRVFNLNNANAVLRGLTVSGGSVSAYYYGGGVMIGANGGLVDNCRISGNFAGMNGGGAGVYMTAGRMTRSIVDNNSNGSAYAMTGGGIRMEGGAVDNCLICGNYVNGSSGGGVYASGGTVSNCTIVANRSITDCGAVATGSDRFVNCIIYGNKYSNASTDVPVQYSGTGFVNCLFPVGTVLPNSCRAGNPKFVDEANFDYHIDVGSAAIKQGVNGCWTADDVDLDGKPRLGENGELDIGCYSYISSGFACAIDASKWKILSGGSATFYAKVDDSVDPEDYVYAWTLTNTTGQARLESSLQNPELRFDTAGRYSVKLVVCAKDSDVPLYEHELPAEFVVSATEAYVVEVNPNAAYPFDSEQTAATNVLEALADLTDGSTLKIGSGTFGVTKSVELLEGITVEGAGADVTTVKGVNVGRVFRLNNANSCVRRLTMKGGNGGNGAGVQVGENGGTVEDCRITGNDAGMNGHGGGVSLSAGTVRRCVIDDNWIDSRGARSGGGVYMAGGLLESCLVMANGSEKGNSDAYHMSGGGIYVEGGTARNCTVVSNRADSASGVCASGKGKAVNMVVCGNPARAGTTSGTSSEWGGGKSLFTNCLFPDDPAMDEENKRPNATCLLGDPLFKNVAELDFHISRGSPAINAGVNDGYAADDTDLGGKPRVHNFGRKSGIADLGCYETPWGTPGFLLLVR